MSRNVTRDVILSAIRVSLAFGGNKVLRDVSLDVDRGQLYALIGPNGAGKTNLFNVLTRIYQADAGQAVFDNDDLFDLQTTDLAAIGIMRTFQNILVLKELSVLDNVMLGLHASYKTSLVSAAFGTGSYRQEEKQARTRARGARDRRAFRRGGSGAGSLPFRPPAVT